MNNKSILSIIILSLVASCGGGGGGSSSGGLANLDIDPAVDADAGSSYTNAKADIHISYFDLPIDNTAGAVLMDAITYLNANDDTDTDVFLGTGQFLLDGEVDSQMFINDGDDTFTLTNTVFNGDVPPATHARKSITADFNDDGLSDIVIFDHGFDSNPFPGNEPKLIIQDSAGSFSWSRLEDQTGFHHCGSAADIDNDGDIDIFVGGFDPFFYVNDGEANFEKVDNRWGGTIGKIFTCELIDIDKDGYVDAIVGAHEQDGDNTTIYWGSSTGSYSQSRSTTLPAVANYGTVLDFEAEDFDGNDTIDIVVNRTGGGNSNFYIGRRVQFIKQTDDRVFTDATNQIDTPGSDVDLWFPWLRAQDIEPDGDIDFFTDDKSDDLLFTNDGDGNFTVGSF